MVQGQPAHLRGAPPSAPSAALPADDPFYRYPVDLSGQAPGTVLKSRPIALGILASGPGLGASQVFYRTTGELGQPAATVATIIEQRGRGRLRGVVSYQDPYDGLGPNATLLTTCGLGWPRSTGW